MVDHDDAGGGRNKGGSKVRLDVDNRVARISFCNPPLNVFTIGMLNEISEAIHTGAREQGVCAILFEAGPESRAFSAGLAIEDHRGELAYQMLDALLGIFRNLNFYSKPTV